MSLAVAEEADVATRPSPSIWKDCPKSLLNDSGRGYYFHEEFLGVAVGTIASGVVRPAYGALEIFCEDDAVVAHNGGAGVLSSSIDMETDGDDNDGAALISGSMAQIDINSGNKVWFEVRAAVNDIADQGAFIGLTEWDAAWAHVIADDVGATAGESYLGFRLLTDDQDAFDLAYKLDAGTEVEILADVTNAPAIPAADRASVVADTFYKFGLVFNGRDQIFGYVNGIRVSATTIAAATFPVALPLSMVIGIKTGTAAAESIEVDWARCAYQARR